ncbi:MAG: glycosyltransferase [Chloroflexi bacterium]|nr:glycosyltransferase [Chloroflexota bacterium]
MVSPFVVNQVCRLSGYRSLVFTYDRIPANGQEVYPGAEVYGPYWGSPLKRNLNRATNRLLGYPWTLGQAIRQQGVRLLHAHFGPYGLYSLPLAQRFRLPLVTSFYGYDMTSLAREPAYRSGLDRLFNQGALFLVEGENARRTLIDLGCPPEKITVHPLGIDLERFPFQSRSMDQNGEVKLLMCNRLVEKKGIPFALEALAQVAFSPPKVTMTILGDGPLREEITAMIQRLRLEDRVTLAGAVSYSRYREELYRHHIMVAPSVTASDGNTEGGAPTVLLEAQASGMPVLATYHADIPEVVKDGESGFLVAERDGDGLAERMRQLMNTPSLWQAMGEAGRRHMVERHNLETQNRKLEEIYDDLIP